MTAEEAIKEFKDRIELGKKEYLKDIPEYIEALEMAIDALEKVEEYKRLEEQGLLIKWIPFKLREMDEEEKECYGEFGFQLLDCPLPDDDEEILITLKDGYVEQDTFLRDGVECYLDGGGEFGTEIIAWASKPKGYKAAERKLKEMEG